MPFDPILSLHFNSGRDFVRALDLTDDHFHLGEWLFRGHGDADYTLSPSIFRDIDGVNRDINAALGFTSRVLSDWEWARAIGAFHVLRECEMLTNFAKSLDSGGLKIPGNALQTELHLEELHAQLVQFLNNTTVENIENLNPRPLQRNPAESWPTRETWQLLALARHFGMPSRLLDWTPTPLIAAYFACADTIKLRRDNEAAPDNQICVWAIHENLWKPFRNHGRWFQFTQRIPVLREGNRNLAAQRGTFSATTVNELGWQSVADTLPLEERIVRLEEELDEAAKVRLHHSMIKFTIDARRARPVLAYLRKIGISRLMVYPDYESVLEDMREDLLTKALVLNDQREDGFPL